MRYVKGAADLTKRQGLDTVNYLNSGGAPHKTLDGTPDAVSSPKRITLVLGV